MLRRGTRWSLLIVAAFAAPAAALAQSKSDLEALVNQWEAKFNAGDAAGVAALYAEDAQLFPPQAEPVSGRPAIQSFWQGALNAGIKSAELEVTEVYGGGEYATEIGRYVLKGADGAEIDHGKYIVLWKKTKDGSWALFRDIWNTNIAPPPPPK